MGTEVSVKFCYVLSLWEKAVCEAALADSTPNPECSALVWLPGDLGSALVAENKWVSGITGADGSSIN